MRWDDFGSDELDELRWNEMRRDGEQPQALPRRQLLALAA